MHLHTRTVVHLSTSTNINIYDTIINLLHIVYLFISSADVLYMSIFFFFIYST